MRTAKGLFPVLRSADHLERAAADTVRGKRRRPDVAWFLFRLEDELVRLRGELEAGTWRPEPFELVTIRDPKPRLISRIPIADRVVHTALVLLLQPVFERSLTADAFACREGFGTHRAALRLLELMRRHPYALHLDVRAYFPSIEVATLRRLLGRRVRDERFLAVVDRVLESGRCLYDTPEARRAARLGADWPPPGRGLPIGASTSQLFAAHVYLAELDHVVKRRWKVPGYVRYIDDMFLFGERRAELREWREATAEWLERERGLRLKAPRAPVLSCRGEVHALGFRLLRAGIEPLPRTLRRLRAAVEREVHREERGPRRSGSFERSVTAWVGLAMFG